MLPMTDPNSDWTPRLLKLYVDETLVRIERNFDNLRQADDRRYEQLREITAKAVETALASSGLAMDKALETSTARFNAIDSKLDELVQRQTEGTGRSGGLSAGWGYLLGFVATASVVASTIINLVN